VSVYPRVSLQRGENVQEMRHGPNKSESKHGAGGRLQDAENAAGGAAPKGLKALGAVAAKKARAAAKPTATQEPGFFGRMFANLPPFSAPDAKLMQLANAMRDANPADPAGDNPAIAAGFTYLGQFIDHDITLDLSPLSETQVDPLMLRNFRTPGLDLDSLYGSGPGPHRFLFAREPAGPRFRDMPKFRLGHTEDSPDQNGVNIPAANKDNDLPRTTHGVAIIADHRNDENLLVAQTHVAFLKFHNRVVDRLKAAGVPDDELFQRASVEVRRHYQWIVLHEFCALLTGADTIRDILRNGRKFYRFRKKPFMPLEFSVAAFRLGHSLVRERYSHNRVFPAGPGGLAVGSLELLFNFSGLSGTIAGEIASGGLSRAVLPTNWIIDWRRFYDFGTPTVPLNATRRLDPFLTPALHALPGEAGPAASLPFRNLRRGVLLKLPSGQAVAAAMKSKIPFVPLTAAEIASGPDGAVAQSLGFHLKTPLWYYILKEAQVRKNGIQLGPVGARIVAEVFIGLLQGDEDSFINQPRWKPSLPSKRPGTFTMTDLLRFVGEISPIDGIGSLP
jgi:hypothetical protein